MNIVDKSASNDYIRETVVITLLIDGVSMTSIATLIIVTSPVWIAVMMEMVTAAIEYVYISITTK